MEFAFFMNILLALYKISVMKDAPKLSSNPAETVMQDSWGAMANYGPRPQLGNHSILHRVNLTRSSSKSNIMFRFKGVSSGKCLESQQGYNKRDFFSDDPDPTLRVWPCSSALKQTFVVFAMESSGESLLITEANKCVGTGVSGNILVMAYGCSYDPVKYNLYWKVVPIGKSNQVQIVAMKERLGKKQCLMERGRSDGDGIVTFDCVAGWTNQIWEIN